MFTDAKPVSIEGNIQGIDTPLSVYFCAKFKQNQSVLKVVLK